MKECKNKCDYYNASHGEFGSSIWCTNKVALKAYKRYMNRLNDSKEILKDSDINETIILDESSCPFFKERALLPSEQKNEEAEKWKKFYKYHKWYEK